MLERLRNLEAAINARARRERLLLAGAVLIVLLLVWDATVRAPVAGQIERGHGRIASLESETEALRGTLTDLRKRLQQGGGGDETVAALRREIGNIDEVLAERTARVISPQQMVSVLRDMLAETPGLSLMALRNRGSEPLISETSEDAGDVPRVFRHRVEVVLRGDYFAVLQYLERLESLQWRFQWDGLALETIEYPQAEVALSISTLSLAEDWVGV